MRAMRVRGGLCPKRPTRREDFLPRPAPGRAAPGGAARGIGRFCIFEKKSWARARTDPGATGADDPDPRRRARVVCFSAARRRLRRRAGAARRGTRAGGVPPAPRGGAWGQRRRAGEPALEVRPMRPGSSVPPVPGCATAPGGRWRGSSTVRRGFKGPGPRVAAWEKSGADLHFCIVLAMCRAFCQPVVNIFAKICHKINIIVTYAERPRVPFADLDLSIS